MVSKSSGSGSLYRPLPCLSTYRCAEKISVSAGAFSCRSGWLYVRPRELQDQQLPSISSGRSRSCLRIASIPAWAAAGQCSSFDDVERRVFLQRFPEVVLQALAIAVDDTVLQARLDVLGAGALLA